MIHNDTQPGNSTKASDKEPASKKAPQVLEEPQVAEVDGNVVIEVDPTKSPPETVPDSSKECDNCSIKETLVEAKDKEINKLCNRLNKLKLLTKGNVKHQSHFR